MTEDADSYTQAEIVRLLKRLDSNVTELSQDFKRLEANYVTRAEWTLWKEANDRELKQIKNDADAAQPPRVSGWVVAGIVISGAVGMTGILAFIQTL